MEQVKVEPMTKKTAVIISDSTSATDLLTPTNDPVIDGANRARMAIRDELITYLSSVYKEKEAEIKRSSKTQASFENKKKRLDEIYAAKKERIERVFGEFQVVSAQVVIYGSPTYSNYAVCNYGKSDWYKNAFWIHENSIIEIMQSVPTTLPVQNDVKEYFTMLKNIKRIAQLQENKSSVC